MEKFYKENMISFVQNIINSLREKELLVICWKKKALLAYRNKHTSLICATIKDSNKAELVIETSLSRFFDIMSSELILRNGNFDDYVNPSVKKIYHSSFKEKHDKSFLKNLVHLHFGKIESCEVNCQLP